MSKDAWVFACAWILTVCASTILTTAATVGLLGCGFSGLNDNAQVTLDD